MKLIYPLLPIAFLLSGFRSSAQQQFLLVMHKQKMTDNKSMGRLIGNPIPSSNFVMDSGYSKFYMCEVKLSSKKLAKNVKIHYLIGQKDTNNLLVIFDKNFNNNFRDDSTISIRLSQCDNCDFKTLEDCIDLNIKKYVDKDLNELELHVVPPCCFAKLKRHTKYPFLDSLNIALESPFEQVAEFAFANKKYTLSLRNLFPAIDMTDEGNVKAALRESPHGHEVVYSFSDTMKIKDSYFRLRNLSPSGDSVILQQLPANNISGYKTGFYAYNFGGQNVSTDTSISLDDFKGRYVLLEFWGTWCNPCLALHDDLVKLLNVHKRVNYVGVAFDKNVNQVKNYISKSPALSQQIFVDMKSPKSSIVTQFRVQNYPSFILINKNGKIVFREYGTDGFSKLVDYINKL